VVPPWLLLRGLTRDARHWGPFPAVLSARLATLGPAPGPPRVLTLDMPGNGTRHREASPASVGTMVEACRATLREQGLAPPWALLAMSLGAMVAVAWAHRHPGELQRCVLINTSLRPYSPPHLRLQPRNYAALLGVLRAHDALAIERTILRLTTRHPGVAVEPLLAQWAAWRRAHPVSRANALNQLWAAMRFVAPRGAPPVPTLLLSGAGDTLVDPRCTRQLVQAWRGTALAEVVAGDAAVADAGDATGTDNIAGSEPAAVPVAAERLPGWVAWQEHPTAGHDLPLDDAAWVADAVAMWLAARAAPPGDQPFSPRKCLR
jgi:pimeloyl-ACP methyl ester carboxylesterase